MKLEDMGSSMTNDQFMNHVLIYLTSDYELQIVCLGKRIGDKANRLEVDELRDNLNQILTIQSEFNSECKANEKHTMCISQFKEKCRNCGQVGHTAVQCKAKRDQGDRQGAGGSQILYCNYCRKIGRSC
jgi:Zinc knuckle